MSKQRLSFERIHSALHSRKDSVGIFESMVGIASGTGSIKNVHIMNDLAQVVCGGMPEAAGDLLCRLVREGIEDEKWDNSEAGLRSDGRFGETFNRSFPVALGSEQVRRLRLGASALLNVDHGMYVAGDQMASPVATNVALLGAEGFRRFRIGPYLASLLPAPALARIRALYTSDTDPVSQALRPLFQAGRLVDRSPAASGGRQLTAFDRSLGARFATLLEQPLSKPVVLRSFALACAMGVLLKVYGAGRAGGIPVLLALPSEVDGRRQLREKAVQSLLRAHRDFDAALARRLAQATAVWRAAGAKESAVEVSAGDREVGAAELVVALRERPAGADDSGNIYWPGNFALRLGRTTGFLLPKDTRAGWGTFFALTPEVVEVLVQMFVPSGERLEWREFWSRVGRELGIVVGANPSQDAHTLADAGVPLVSLQELMENSEALLEQGVQRGVARRLPDSGAEVGGVE